MCICKHASVFNLYVMEVLSTDIFAAKQQNLIISFIGVSTTLSSILLTYTQIYIQMLYCSFIYSCNKTWLKLSHQLHSLSLTHTYRCVHLQILLTLLLKNKGSAHLCLRIGLEYKQPQKSPENKGRNQTIFFHDSIKACLEDSQSIIAQLLLY